ncbi:synaptosomal-associated protein- 23kDa [Apiospora aurea]|uniref:Synaptosomal-associated protein- 23kDa n=1 Tax=Apiospora aurea TaxID=335848 RepID=A0ABR1QEU7_9PEZI
MGRFGFGKKDDDKKGSENPYARGGNDPYATPMTGAQATYNQYKNQPVGGGLPGGPRGGPGGLPGGPRGGAPSLNRNGSSASNETAPPPYSNSQQPSGGYSNEKFGSAGGYGSSRYDSGGAGRGARGPGGYGGLGGGDADSTRDALFSGARERADQRQQQPSAAPGAGDYGTPSTSYGGYGQHRELTAEEQEEEEVQDVKRQIKETKMASANSAENSERIAAQAVETALGTYARLGAQHERLNYTETLLDKASTSTREADASTKKLKSLNRSMFAVHVNNPFTSSKRTAEMEARTLEQHRADRDMRDATRKAGYDANAHMEQGFKEIDKAQRSTDKWSRSSKAEKSKYAFEDDSEDDQNEDRIDDAMERTAGHVSTLNSVAKLMGKEIEGQNNLIDRLGDKSVRLDDAARLNTERLKRIR